MNPTKYEDFMEEGNCRMNQESFATGQEKFKEEEVEIITTEDGRLLAQHSWNLSLEEFVGKVNELVSMADSFEVKDPLSLEVALDFTSEVLNVKSRIESYRKELCKPHRQVIQSVNDCAKKLTETLDQIKTSITIKLAQWQQQQEIAALKAKEEAKKLSESLGISIDVIAPDAHKTMSSSKASTASRERITFTVVNDDLVPEEYWVIDDRLIQKHIDLGKREIPGIELSIEKNLIIRRKA